jgi:hypothetical protein
MPEANVAFGMEVYYPRGDVPYKTICLKLNLFKGAGYTINPIVLESKGIDIILGTD